MPSFKKTCFAVAAAFVASAQADYSIDPNSVPLSTRKSWCQNEIDTCPIICQQVEPRTTEVNTCDPTALTYGCLCGDGKQPNMSEYSLTLPYHVCEEYGNQCVANCGLGNNQCASDCRQNNPCGATNPTRQNKTTTSTTTASATASQTSGAIFTGLAGGTGSSDSNSGAAALAVGREAGFAVLIGSLIGGFALLL